MNPRAERGAVAIGAVALLLLLALVAGAGLRAGRSLVLDERVHGSADAVALAAATVLDRRYGDAVDAGGSPSAVRVTQQAARAAAERAAGRLGLTLESISFERGGHDASPLAVRVHVVAGRHGASARAGVGLARPRPWRGSAPPTCAALTPPGPSSRRPSRSSAGRTSGVARAARRADSTARG